MLQNRITYWVSIFTILILLTGCSSSDTGNKPTITPAGSTLTPAATSRPLVMETATVLETATQPNPSEEITASPVTNLTEEPDEPLEGETTALSINMRSGPSTVHDVVGTYNIGTVVLILGTTPNGDWYYVQPRDGNFGWMVADFLKPYVEQASIPVIVPTPATLFSGKVINTMNDSGINGVTIAIVQGSDDGVLRAEAVTMENGEFEAYLPDTINGLWRAVVVGVNCDSNIMNGNCEYAGRFSPDLGITFTLPAVPELDFDYAQ